MYWPHSPSLVLPGAKSSFTYLQNPLKPALFTFVFVSQLDISGNAPVLQDKNYFTRWHKKTGIGLKKSMFYSNSRG